MSKEILEGKNLSLTRGKHRILEIENFSLKPGETLALIGPNGSGKSTLLQVLSLLQRPGTGELFYKGERVHWRNAIGCRRKMAMVFQESLLLDTTVAGNIASGLKIRGFQKETIQGRVDRWLKRLGIAHLANRSVRFLSGGESQRVSLARAFVMEPEVLFLDEPFSALDAPSRTGLIPELAGILQDTQISTVFVTHDFSEIPLLASSVVALEKGRVVQTGPPREILTRPASLTVASLVGMDNVIPGRVAGIEGASVIVQAGPHSVSARGPDLPGSGPVHILLRPEDVKLNGQEAGSGNNRLNGEIVKLLPHGGLFKAVVDCGFTLVALLSSEQVLEGKVATGEKVSLSFESKRVHLLHREE